MAAYPDVKELLTAPDKSELLQVRRSWRSILSNIFASVAAAIIVYGINNYFEEPRLRWLGIVPALLLLESLRRYHDDLYTIGESSITHRSGRLSLSYSIPVVKYLHIRSLAVIQDIWGRIFDYGDISIATAAQDRNEMIIKGVRSPLGLASLLEDLRTHHRNMQRSLESPEAHEEMSERSE